MWLLLMIGVLGAGASAIATAWVTAAQREKEAELLFVGEQYRRAIASYVASSPARAYPKSLDELLEDRRLPVPQRHLRKRYRDPMTGSADWGLVLVAGGIAGVYSRSPLQPFKRAGFKASHAHFAVATTYAEWKFSAELGAAGTIALPPSSAVPTNAPALDPVAPLPSGVIQQPAFAPSLPPVQPPSVKAKPVTQSTARLAVERQCRLMARSDATSCASMRASRGEAVGSRCEQSAASRASQCVELNAYEGALPQLVTD